MNKQQMNKQQKNQLTNLSMESVNWEVLSDSQAQSISGGQRNPIIFIFGNFVLRKSDVFGEGN